MASDAHAAAYGGRTNEAVADLHKALLAGRQEGVPSAKSLPAIDTASLGGLDIRSLKEPGAFRRNHLHKVAEEQGIPEHERPAHWNSSLLERIKPHWQAVLYEAAFGIRLDDDGNLLPPVEGESGVPQTICAIWKSFVGSGITFLPGAFLQGGWLFSSVVLAVIAVMNAVCIRLLLNCRDKTGLTGFGEIAYRACGTCGKQAVHVSLVISQFATNVAYMIFIGEMADSLGAAAFVSRPQVIAILVVVLIPLCWLRSIHKMEYAILAADVLIVFGLGAVLFNASSGLAERGADPALLPFRPATCGLFMGTAIFTFEGIPYILPIVSSMKEPERFWPLFVKNFVGIICVFVGFGLAGYAAFGAEVKPVVLLNLPDGAPVTASVRAAYMLALLLSTPLVFGSAARITELWVFGIVKPKGAKKWQKNAMRAVELMIFGVIAVCGGEYFTEFLALTGAICCAPIAFIYPALFHMVICADSVLAKAVDVFFILVGVAAMAFVLWETL